MTKALVRQDFWPHLEQSNVWTHSQLGQLHQILDSFGWVCLNRHLAPQLQVWSINEQFTCHTIGIKRVYMVPFLTILLLTVVGLLPSSLNSALKDLRINPRNDCPFISSTSRKERIKCRTVSSGSLQNTHSPASTISKKNAYLPPVSQTELRPYLQHDTLAVRHVCRNHCKL